MKKLDLQITKITKRDFLKQLKFKTLLKSIGNVCIDNFGIFINIYSEIEDNNGNTDYVNIFTTDYIENNEENIALLDKELIKQIKKYNNSWFDFHNNIEYQGIQYI